MEAFFKERIKAVFVVLVLMQLMSCANIVPPTGGDTDTTPPKLLSMSPEDSVLNQRVKKIVLHFNKFVEVRDLDKHLTLSPLLAFPPTVTAIGKRVEIKLTDSLLKDNTTYKIALSNAITDNRERTPYSNFTYTFSTGSYFDSMEVKGQVRDMLSGQPDTGMSVVLYHAETFNDSMILSKKPVYLARTDGRGSFRFTGLPQSNFRIFAIADADNNTIYDMTKERIGFLDSTIVSKQASDSGTLLLYTSLAEKRTLVKDSLLNDSLRRVSEQFVGRVTSKGKNALAYSVVADTISKDKGTFELTQPLQIKLNAVLKTLDSAKVFLSYLSSGVEAEASRSITHDTGSLYIRDAWLPETRYTLRLVKGWAIDSSGNELPPGRYQFVTKSLDDYAKLQIRVGKPYSDSQHVMLVIQDKDTLYHQTLKDSIVTLQLLKPGKCKIIVFHDLNGNGTWDPGNVLLKRQPEFVFQHESEVVLKAGWEHEVDFKYVPAASAHETRAHSEREKNGKFKMSEE